MHYNLCENVFCSTVKGYLQAAICRADLSAPRNREANRRV